MGWFDRALRGAATGVATGAAAADKYIIERGQEERAYKEKWSLEEFAAEKRREEAARRFEYDKEIKRMDIESREREGALDRASMEERARISQSGEDNKPVYLDGPEKKEGFKSVGLAIASVYPELFPDDTANIFTLDPSKLTPTSIDNVLTKVTRAAGDDPRLAPIAKKLREWSDIGSNPRLTYEQLKEWRTEVLELVDPLGVL